MQTQRETTALPQSVPERISLALLARLVELRKANVVTSSSYWEEWSQFKGKKRSELPVFQINRFSRYLVFVNGTTCQNKLQVSDSPHFQTFSEEIEF